MSDDTQIPRPLPRANNELTLSVSRLISEKQTLQKRVKNLESVCRIAADLCDVLAERAKAGGLSSNIARDIERLSDDLRSNARKDKPDE
jgi:hypothetical protein